MGYLDMFDKLDDLVYEPIKLVCDALRQPIKNSDAKLQAKLANDAMAFAVEMDLRKKSGEAEIEQTTKERQAKMESMIKDDELAHNTKILDAVEKYQENLGTVSHTLLSSIADMHVTLRYKAHEMCENKTRAYKAIQDEAMDKAFAYYERANNSFPEGSRAHTMITSRIDEQLASIIQRADDFISILSKDMEQLSKSFNSIVEQSQATTNQLLSPMHAQEISGKLQQSPVRETKLLR